ncbi:MAG: hypothetical protein Q8859_08365 [Bacteroidota bacterium]|nr:hypothetical protein [Bacteroidota bacterium]
MKILIIVIPVLLIFAAIAALETTVPGVKPQIPNPIPRDSVVTISYPYHHQNDTSAVFKKHASHGWPLKIPIYKNSSLIPRNFIVAYYGTLENNRMGVLGEYHSNELLFRLNEQIDKWKKVLHGTPVTPAIQQIVVVAQNKPMADGMYRRRVGSKIVEEAYALAKRTKGILIMDIQPGHSNVQSEIRYYGNFLLRPDVHVAIDPEFYMHDNRIPGRSYGHMNTSEINWCIQHLKKIVIQNGLPPKVLIIHRFFKKMIIVDEKIKLEPEVQLIIEMDGFGSPALKRNSFYYSIYNEPLSFAGFKLFYKNDVTYGKRMMQPQEVLGLYPPPVYVQYQ